MKAYIIMALLCLCTVSVCADPPRNLVRNPGFEVGEKMPNDWAVHEDVEAQSAGTTERDSQVFHGGAASLHLHLPGRQPDVQAVVQSTELVGNLEKLRGMSVYFNAWVKTRDAVFLHVWLEFIDEKEFQISIHNLSPTRPLTGTVEWSELGRVVTIPENTHTMAIGISLYYGGDLWVDDVGLTVGMSDADVAAALARTTPPKPEATPALLGEAQGACYATAVQACADGAARVRLSVPFPFEGQAPLCLRIGSIPPDRIQDLKIVRDPSQDQVEVALKAMAAGETVRLFWQSLVIASDRLIDSRPLVEAKIAAPEAYPENARRWLVSEPGVELEVPIVQGMAERLKSYQGFYLDFLQGMNAAVQDRLSLRDGGDQGADFCLSSNKADTVGFANAATAIARAAGVPTRLLACIPTEGESGEQFLAEMYGPGVGWVRCEPVSGAFPWSDFRQVVIRVIDPAEARAPDKVPLPIHWSGPLRAGLIQGALKQAAALRLDEMGGRMLPFADVDALLGAARKKWDAAVAAGLAPEARLLAAADLPADLRTRLAGTPFADPDALVDAAWKRHANLLDSLTMGWGQSLVKNPGFEEENRGRPTGWHIPPEQRSWVDASVAEGTALRGKKALKAVLKENRNRYEVVSQRVNHFPVGLPLVLSVYARGKCLGDVVVQASYMDESRNVLPGTKPLTAHASLGDGSAWRRLALDLEAPRATATIEVALLTEGPGEVWFDEFDLRAGGGFPAYPGEELLVNTGFEDGGTDGLPTGWRAERPPAAPDTMDLAQEVSGRESKWAGYLAATQESAAYHGLAQTVRFVPATGRVKLTGWVRTDRVSGVATMSLQFRRTPFDEDTAMMESVTTEKEQPVKGTTKWRPLTIEADVPGDTLSIVVRVGATGSGKVWWDDVSLQAVGK